jgi:hypothetical protein
MNKMHKNRNKIDPENLPKVRKLTSQVEEKLTVGKKKFLEDIVDIDL